MPPGIPRATSTKLARPTRECAKPLQKRNEKKTTRRRRNETATRKETQRAKLPERGKTERGFLVSKNK
jgi:hypothetical protein